MNQSVSQSLPGNWTLTMDALSHQFARERQANLVKSIGQSLLGGYQQLMTASARGKRVAEPKPSAAPDSRQVEQIGENLDRVEHVLECVSIKQRGRQIITAVRTTKQQLKLLSWRVNAAGAVVCTGTSGPQPGQATQIAIARAHKFVTACRTATQQLQLVSWDVSNTGAIYRAGASGPATVAPDAAIDKVKLIALNDQLLLTVCTTAKGQMALTTWRLHDDDSLTPVYACTSADEALRDVTPVCLPSTLAGFTIVTVARTYTNELKFQLWQVEPTGAIVAGVEHLVADEKIHQFDVVAAREGQLVTAVRTQAGRLRLHVWHCSPEQQTIHQLFDSGPRGERVRKPSLMHYEDQIIVQVQMAPMQCKLMAWHIAPTGTLRWLDETIASHSLDGPLGLCQEALDGNAPILSSGVTPEGALQLLTWRTSPTADQR